MVQRGAAGTEGVADISQAGVVQPSRLQRFGKRRDQLVELFATGGGKWEQPGPLAWPRERLLRRRFEDQVAAGSAGAEGVDQRAPGPPPLAQPVGDGKAARLRADHGTERVAAEGRRDLPVLQLHQHLGDLRQRRRGLKVADIGLDRSHHQRCIVAGRAAEHLADRRELGPVRQAGTGGCSLDIADRLGGQARLLQYATHRHGLAVGIRRAVTGGLAAMADRRRPDDTENPVAMPHGLFERPDQQRADAFAGDPPVGIAAEGMGLAIAGQQFQRGQQLEVRGVADQVDAADNRRLALALPDAVARKMQRGHRRRTRGIDHHAGAIEIVEEGHPVGDRREKRGGPSAVLRGREMLVVAPHRADKHADPPGLPPQARGSMAAVFQAMPDRLQEQALLGIQRPGLGRGDPEQQGIEQVLAGQRPHRPLWRVIRGVATVEQRFATQCADGRAARAQVPPERVGVGGAGIPTADPDDRHRMGIDVRIGHPGSPGRPANLQPRPVGGQRLRDGATDKAVHQIVALVQRKGVADLVEIHRTDGAQPNPELALPLQQQLADPSGLEQREIAAFIAVGRGAASDDKDAQPRLAGVLTVERGIAAVDRRRVALADPAQAVAADVVAVDPARHMRGPATLRCAVLGKVQVDLRRQPGIGVIQAPAVLVGPQQAQQPAQLPQAQRPAVVLPLGGPQPQRIGADRRGRQCDHTVALLRQVTADLPLLLVQLRQFLPARQGKTVVFPFQEIGEHGAGPAPVRIQRLASPSLDRRRRALDQAMQEPVARPQPEQLGDCRKVNAIGRGQRDAEVVLAGQQQVFNVARFEHQQGGGGTVVDRRDRIGFGDQEQGKARLVQLRALFRPENARIQPGRYADRQQAVQPRLVIVDAAGQAIDPPFGRVEVTLDRIEAACRGVERFPLPVQRDLPQQRQQPPQPFEIRRRTAARPPVGPGIEADRVQWNRLADGLPADRRSVRWRRIHLAGHHAFGIEDMSGNRGDGRLFEEDIHRQRRLVLLLDAVDRLHQREGGRALVKQIIVDRQPGNPKHLGKVLLQPGVQRLGIDCGRTRLGHRPGVTGEQRLAVRFAVRGHGNPVNQVHQIRHHVFRQAGFDEIAHRFPVQPLRHHKGYQLGIVRAGILDQHHRIVDRRMVPERALDLAELDAESAQLDLRIKTAEQFDLAIAEETRLVARAVEPRVGLVRKRVADELFGRQIGAVEIAPGQADTADAQLAGIADRDRLGLGIQDVDLDIVDRPPDRHALVFPRLAGPTGDIHRRLGRAVQVMQPGAQPFAELEQQVVGQRLAAHEDLLQGPARGNRRMLEKEAQHRRHKMAEGDPLCLDAFHQVVGVLVTLRPGHHQAGAAEQRQEQLPDRDIEGIGRLLQDPVRRADVVMALHPQQAVADRPMRQHAPFGPPRGARGVDDVGEILRAIDRRRIVIPARQGVLRGIIQAEHGAGMAVQPVPETLLRQHDGHRGVLDHQRQALLGVTGIQRQIGAAGLEDRQQRDDQLDRTLHLHAHHAVAPGSQRPQAVRQPIGPAIQFAVAQGLAVKTHRHRVRAALDLRFDQLVQAPVQRVVPVGVVPTGNDLAFVSIHESRS